MQFKHFDIVSSNTLGERFQTAVVIRLPEQNGIYLFPFGGDNGFAARFVRLMRELVSYRYDEFYADKLTRSAHYALFLKRIVERNYWLLSDGTLPVNGKQTSLIQSVSQIHKIDNVDVEKMFLDCARECNSGEIYEPLIKDMAFLFNFIKNHS